MKPALLDNQIAKQITHIIPKTSTETSEQPLEFNRKQGESE